jgi:hypothetical protein
MSAFTWTPRLDDQLQEMVGLLGNTWKAHAKVLRCTAKEACDRYGHLTKNYTKGMHAAGTAWAAVMHAAAAAWTWAVWHCRRRVCIGDDIAYMIRHG